VTRASDPATMAVHTRTEVDRVRFKNDLGSHPWPQFVMCADYGYFVARTLLSQGVSLYGLFCAHPALRLED
jgi:hypothetical protein